MKRERPCEAPIHTEDCECQKCTHYAIGCSGCPFTTIDHFTPRAIAKGILNWGNSQVSDKANIQVLSRKCHQEKDRTTYRRFLALLKQEKGVPITMNDVKNWAEDSEYNR